MAKRVAIVAVLVALVALATATTYTTTVTTTTLDDEANPEQHQQCQRQLQGRQFRSCQMYLSQRWSPYMGGQDDEFLEMSTSNPGQGGQQQQQQQRALRQCCEELRNVNEQCRCEAIRHAVRQSQQQQEGGSWKGGQMQQVYEKARNIPRQCQFRQQECQIRAIFV